MLCPLTFEKQEEEKVQNFIPKKVGIVSLVHKLPRAPLQQQQPLNIVGARQEPILPLQCQFDVHYTCSNINSTLKSLKIKTLESRTKRELQIHVRT